MYLAKLAHFFAPAVVAARKIFDADLAKYAAQGLHFRHTDNINYFLQVSRQCKVMGEIQCFPLIVTLLGDQREWQKKPADLRNSGQ